ncbi:Mov34/MPN/PAD-1 family protein [soil metagenome]
MTAAAWVLGNLRMTRSVIDRIDEEARAHYERGEESCGLLTGPASDARLIDAIAPLKNRANALHALDPATYPRTAREYFDADPLKVARAIEAGAAAAQPVKVLYHSHLDVGAYFSETDAEAATMGGDAPTHEVCYLVTSVRSGGVDDRKLFVWDGGKFVESPFTVVNDA